MTILVAKLAVGLQEPEFQGLPMNFCADDGNEDITDSNLLCTSQGKQLNIMSFASRTTCTVPFPRTSLMRGI